MASATTEFFEDLSRRGHEPLLDKANGTIRFDLTSGKSKESWYVSIDHGDVSVSHRRGAADCTVRSRKDLFDRVATGEVNAMAAFLRGAFDIEGDTLLVVLFQRLFPAPTAAAGR
jgi:putative sterol carrier protein